MYNIINFKCKLTYGGLLTSSDIRKTNTFIKENILKDLEQSYGSGRKVISDFPEKIDDFFPPYVFIAWLSDDNPGNIKDEEGVEYHGRDLFIIGFSNAIDDVVADIRKMGDKYFDTEARGFFY